jgi:amidase
MSTDADVCFLPATELASGLHAKHWSAREVLDAHLGQIELLNPSVNAVVTLTPELAREQARRADDALARGEPLGPLHGLPVAHKDLQPTKGIRTTYGSPLLSAWVPELDSLTIERMKAAGAVQLGKTNVPEFGAGSQTYNNVFGPTKNPYDISKTCGGSSGGAAVALACGMIALADGSDYGGSLRNPASFCNVVGLRPSPGRVPAYPTQYGWETISVTGPMGRTVADVALLLSVIAGPDARTPIALADPGETFAHSLDGDFRGTRIAWSRDLGGLPFEREVLESFDAQRVVFESMGCSVRDATPDFTDADEAFETLRHFSFYSTLGVFTPEQRLQLKPELQWEHDAGSALRAEDLARAERLRTSLYHRLHDFFLEHDFLVAPVSQVLPFDVGTAWVEQIDGVQMQSYIEWIRSCCRISITGCPAISVPSGFSNGGLPIGIQIIGRQRDDWGVLQLAHAFERESGEAWKGKPEVAAGASP